MTNPKEKIKATRKTAWEKEYDEIIEKLEKVPATLNRRTGEYEMNYQSTSFQILDRTGVLKRFEKLKALKIKKCQKEDVAYIPWRPTAPWKSTAEGTKDVESSGEWALKRARSEI